MGWTPEFGQKESPQKALHSPTTSWVVEAPNKEWYYFVPNELEV